MNLVLRIPAVLSNLGASECALPRELRARIAPQPSVLLRSLQSVSTILQRTSRRVRIEQRQGRELIGFKVPEHMPTVAVRAEPAGANGVRPIGTAAL
jgi:hypothetical protein